MRPREERLREEYAKAHALTFATREYYVVFGRLMEQHAHALDDLYPILSFDAP